MTDKSLAPVTPSEWSMMKEQAEMLLHTGFLPQAIKTPEQAVAIMLKGRELGIPPMYALSNIAVIQGKPTANAELMLALIYRDHGDPAVYNIRSDHEVAEYAYKRRGWSDYRKFSFTIEQARKAGIAGGQNWTKYPAAMLRARAVSAIARLAFPDSIGGMYTPEELGVEEELTEDGETILKLPTSDITNTPSPTITILPTSENLDEETTWPEPLAVHAAEYTERAPTADTMLEALRGTNGPDLFAEDESDTEPVRYDWQDFSTDVFDHMNKLGAADKLKNTVLDLIYKDLGEQDRSDSAVLLEVLSEIRTWTKLSDATMFATTLANKRREAAGRR